ncbi:MAG: hypothetical protein QF775_01430, partial [archaeon]|nr:hypothetical protein [archaeon]
MKQLEGIPGPRGLQGLTGLQGPRGVIGLTGLQGATGAAGSRGSSGSSMPGTTIFQGSNVFQGPGQFDSLGIRYDVSVGRAFSTGDTTILGNKSNDVLTVNATSTFAAPTTVEDTLAVTQTSSSLALDVSGGAVTLGEAALAVSSKVADDLLFQPMWNSISLTGTRGQLPTYTDDTDSVPAFSLVQDTDGLAPGGRGYTVGTGSDSETLTYLTSGNMDADDGTVSFWYSPSFASTADGTKYLFETANHLRIYYSGADDKFYAEVYNGTDWISSRAVPVNTESFSAGDYLYIAVAYDNDAAIPVALHVNNTRTTDADTWTAQSLPTTFYVGSDSSAANQANGDIIDLNIFSRALTQQEIQQLYYLSQPVSDYAHTTTPYAMTVTVAKYGGDYTSISAALAAISGSSSQPALIQVYPGT